MVEVIPDSSKTHWVNRAPERIRPYLQLSRLDRPVGYWLLALPGWIGLAFAGLSHGLIWMDLVWAVLILIGAIAMRGAGCTYNDIVDQDLDAQVERTALRPLPAGTVTTRQAWRWTFAQVGVGFLVWLCLPWLAKGIALLAHLCLPRYGRRRHGRDQKHGFAVRWSGEIGRWGVLFSLCCTFGFRRFFRSSDLGDFGTANQRPNDTSCTLFVPVLLDFLTSSLCSFSLANPSPPQDR